jgi:hypothetical protein
MLRQPTTQRLKISRHHCCSISDSGVAPLFNAGGKLSSAMLQDRKNVAMHNCALLRRG